MIRKLLLASAAFAFAATAANAHQLSFSPDHRFVSVSPGKSVITDVVSKKGKVKYVWSNLATKYKNGLYFCCYGSTISGPSSSLGAAYGTAVQFTSPSSTSVTQLVSDVGYFGPSVNSFELVLYADSNNSPGAVLASGDTTANGAFGDCCALTVATISSTKLNQGTNYWIGVLGTGTGEGAAGFETIDQVDSFYRAYTSNGGSSWSVYNEVNFLPAVGVAK